jgi:hypothetical protein
MGSHLQDLWQELLYSHSPANSSILVLALAVTTVLAYLWWGFKKITDAFQN